MPLYVYRCPVCGHTAEEVRPISQRNNAWACPSHDTTKGKICGLMERDEVAGMRVHTDLDYHTPILSNAAGISPSQIAEARQKFPHHEYHPDGRMIFRSHRQRERALKDIGFHDNN